MRRRSAFDGTQAGARDCRLAGSAHSQPRQESAYRREDLCLPWSASSDDGECALSAYPVEKLAELSIGHFHRSPPTLADIVIVARGSI